jgi:hypothetical protein
MRWEMLTLSLASVHILPVRFHHRSYSKDSLWEVFCSRIISNGLWPACSPDLNLCNFYGNHKEYLKTRLSHNEEWRKISEEISMNEGQLPTKAPETGGEQERTFSSSAVIWVMCLGWGFVSSVSNSDLCRPNSLQGVSHSFTWEIHQFMGHEKTIP